MVPSRVYPSDDYMTPSEGEPLRRVVVSSAEAVVVAWYVLPGQRIAAHTHPHGQDTWTVLAGSGLYQVDAEGHTVPISAGDIVVANKGEVHGVMCTSTEPLRLISVVAPMTAGYERL